MSKQSTTIIAKHEEEKLRLKTYLFGFGASLLLTLTAYLMVDHHIASTSLLVCVVIILALTQFFVQIYYFLHLGAETKPRWKLVVFIFMVSVVLIIVFGSIWIIDNLNNRMTIPQQIQYMNNQNGL
jgi:cytochrome o ubiquinol oxidase operon protein cyoD